MQTRRENALKCCMIVQQLEQDYFEGWNETERKALDKAKTGSLFDLIGVIGQRLFDAGIGMQECHAILHDNDWNDKVWSDVECKYVTEKKTDHVHIVMKFCETNGKVAGNPTLPRLSQILGIQPQSIEKAKKGNNAYDNMLAYLIHIKDSDKTLYSPDKVISHGLTKNGIPMYDDYRKIYNYRKSEWENGKAIKKANDAKTNIDKLEEMILSGEVTKSQVILTDAYYTIYSRNCRRCEDAFTVYGERRAYKTLKAMIDGEFKLSVFFITGVAGSGKTRMAKQFVNSLIQKSADYDDAWRVCQTAATNPMDDYNGEEILFMDDVRGSAMSASDWLKLLDPYNVSPSSARYKNKVPACRVIIITSTKEPIEFFYYCKQMGGGNRSEALDQFMRRIQCLTRVIKADDFEDTTAMISNGQSGETYIASIPDSIDKNGNPTRVALNYSFENGDILSYNSAINRLVETAIDNNFAKEGSS